MEEKQLLHKLNTFLEESSEEERTLLDIIVDGFTKKRRGDYKTYLDAMTHIETRMLDSGEYEIVLPVQPLIENPLKMVHGGMTATLLDTTMGSLVNQSLPADSTALTAEMNVHYLKPGLGKHLRCVASLTHKGKQLCVTEGKVYDQNGKLVAIATATFFIITKPKK
ncbi:PaaI family thioesterase [Halalkalibacter alkalisediminis]|uniref:PaaI family thioesterase n=1 Tax=Halalkalibacter alkalisediminis TaxID=935616 RepID=A0ABV6NDA9_9BACI|nr:PaaI family thioesterase [Halalkalibacter alkalisediminis]